MGWAENIAHNLKWRALLEHLVQVLRVNVCIVDPKGQAIVIPNQNPFGWELLADSGKLLSQSNLSGEWQEWVDELKLHHFSIAIGSRGKTEAHIILGPVILNKKLERSQYQQLASEADRTIADLDHALDGVRVITYTNLKHITDFIQGLIELARETSAETATSVVTKSDSKDIFQSMLERSLEASNAGSGSIMLFDLKTNELSVRTAKGLDERYVKRSIKLDEGIAGMAFTQKKTFILTDHAKHSRMSRFLNRKEIKQSIVMPFEGPNKTISGVLSLNIMDELSVQKGAELKHITERLSNITSSALQSI